MVKLIQSLERAIDVLDCVAGNNNRPLTLGEIAKMSHLNAATCSHIVNTLVMRQLLHKVSRREGYILGPEIYHLTRNGPYRNDLVSAAMPHMRKVAQETQEAVVLSILYQGRRIVLHQIDGSHSLQVKDDLIIHDDPYTAATGWLLLSYLPDEELSAFMESHELPNASGIRIDSEKELRQTLAKIRADEMFVNTKHPEIIQVAYPIFDADHKAVAGIGSFLPKYRFDKPEHKDAVCGNLREASDNISRALKKRG